MEEVEVMFEQERVATQLITQEVLAQLAAAVGVELGDGSDAEDIKLLS